jgi:hypothetical protein
VPEPIWRRALIARAKHLLADTNRARRSRLALAEILRRTGYDVGLVVVSSWSRAQQGEAYLWAIARLAGREDLPAPEWIAKVAR